ncbi:MAG: ThuA domain-containing protein [Tannerellaceae bacterium]|nr:ThuA domain-containing protein [Tannerellaceae bacterium]
MKYQILKKLSIVLTAFLFICSASARKPIKTLLVTGQNNHNWQVSHKALKQTLENSGLFTVDLAVSPEQGKDMTKFTVDFTPYELVVLDYNGDAWPEETKNGFINYVKNGGGVVVYHAANNSFPDWKEYNEICALGGWEGRNEKSGPYAYWKDGKLQKDDSPGIGGSHGEQHVYILNSRAEDHPVSDGLPNTWLHVIDELYDRMRGPAHIEEVLFTAHSDVESGGSGREEPLMFTVTYGDGRIFHTMLGHAGESLKDNPAMQCTGFQVTLLRGAEWAATGNVTQKVPADFPSSSKFSMRPQYKEVKDKKKKK